VGKRLKGDGIVYLLGHSDGPVKIGLTVTNVKRRQEAASREVGQPVSVLCQFSCPRAWLIEKFAHLYLQDFHLHGEWFDVNADGAKAAVHAAIRLLDGTTSPVIPQTWFEIAGVEPAAAQTFLLTRPTRDNMEPQDAPDLIGRSLSSFRDMKRKAPHTMVRWLGKWEPARRKRERNAKRAALKEQAHAE
jgi:hypothetical protein